MLVHTWDGEEDPCVSSHMGRYGTGRRTHVLVHTWDGEEDPCVSSTMSTCSSLHKHTSSMT